MAVLVASGAGYIGSHIIVELLEDNKEVIIVDNFSNSSTIELEKLQIKTSNFMK